MSLPYPWEVASILGLGLLLASGAEAMTPLPPLQPLIDAAEPNSVLIPAPGTYGGPVRIDKPLTLEGQGKVTIDAGGQGSVVFLDTDGATLRGLHLTNSGGSHNDIDAAVQVRGNFNVISDNRIDNCLFGVDLQQSEHNKVRRNQITSKDVELGVRGDAVRLWYSFGNEVTDNLVRNSRDIVVWYSKDNLIARNDARGGRYSLHFMYSQHNDVEDNHFEDNSVGIFLMYSDGLVVRRNTIMRATGPTGIGIGFNETSDVVIADNRILYCAVGLYLDISPYQPDTTNRFTNNLIAYNGVGIRWLNDWQGNEFRGNRFKGNISQVVVDGGKSANRNLWEGNFWEDFEGFDRDQDGVGDTPYELYAYADRIWMDVPPAQFFKGSPLLEVLDFLERLAPFTQPSLLVRDPVPLLLADAAPVPHAVQAGTDPDESPAPSSEATAPPSSYELLRKSLGRH